MLRKLLSRELGWTSLPRKREERWEWEGTKIRYEEIPFTKLGKKLLRRCWKFSSNRCCGKKCNYPFIRWKCSCWKFSSSWWNWTRVALAPDHCWLSRFPPKKETESDFVWTSKDWTELWELPDNHWKTNHWERTSKDWWTGHWELLSREQRTDIHPEILTEKKRDERENWPDQTNEKKFPTTTDRQTTERELRTSRSSGPMRPNKERGVGRPYEKIFGKRFQKRRRKIQLKTVSCTWIVW